jgi:hypothetical protein
MNEESERLSRDFLYLKKKKKKKREEKKEGKGPVFFVFLQHKQSVVIYSPQKCPDFILY